MFLRPLSITQNVVPKKLQDFLLILNMGPIDSRKFPMARPCGPKSQTCATPCGNGGDLRHLHPSFTKLDMFVHLFAFFVQLMA